MRDKNYSYKTNHIMNYIVNYININAKASCSAFGVSFITTEKIREVISGGGRK